MCPSFPDDSFQRYVGEFWMRPADRKVRRGSLVWAFVPHISLIPTKLTVVGRGDNPEDHSTATYRIDTLRIVAPRARSQLPVAALPAYPNESYVVFRAKKRPCVVLSTGGIVVERKLAGGDHPKWQTQSTMTVAPFYGADRAEKRAGWNPALVDRIRRGEYPQFMWDVLPISGAAFSIMRLDHAQPIGCHGDSYEPAGFELTPPALDLVDEWWSWLRTGLVAADGILNMIQAELRSDAG